MNVVIVGLYILLLTISVSFLLKYYDKKLANRK